jgi:hypothetical protein
MCTSVSLLSNHIRFNAYIDQFGRSRYKTVRQIIETLADVAFFNFCNLNLI